MTERLLFALENHEVSSTRKQSCWLVKKFLVYEVTLESLNQFRKVRRGEGAGRGEGEGMKKNDRGNFVNQCFFKKFFSQEFASDTVGRVGGNLNKIRERASRNKKNKNK